MVYIIEASPWFLHRTIDVFFHFLSHQCHLVIVIVVFIVAASVRFLHRTIDVVPFDLCSNQHHSISVVISVVCFMVTMASLLQLRPDSPPNDQLSPIKFPQSSAPFHFRIHQRPTTVWPGLMPASISTFRFEVFFPTPRAILHAMAMELLIELHLTLLIFNVWVNSSPYSMAGKSAAFEWRCLPRGRLNASGSY